MVSAFKKQCNAHKRTFARLEDGLHAAETFVRLEDGLPAAHAELRQLRRQLRPLQALARPFHSRERLVHALERHGVVGDDRERDHAELLRVA